MLVHVYHYASKPFDILSAFQIYHPFTIIYYRICSRMQSIQHTQITSCGRLPIRQYPLLYLVVLLLTIPVPLSTVQDIVPTVQDSQQAPFVAKCIILCVKVDQNKCNRNHFHSWFFLMCQNYFCIIVKKKGFAKKNILKVLTFERERK